MGGRAPRAPPLDPPLNVNQIYQTCDIILRQKNYFFFCLANHEGEGLRTFSAAGRSSKASQNMSANENDQRNYLKTLIIFIHFKLACSRLSDSGEDAKEIGTRNVGGEAKRKKDGREFSPSFLPFYFRVCPFSIQRTRLTPSLEQADFK